MVDRQALRGNRVRSWLRRLHSSDRTGPTVVNLNHRELVKELAAIDGDDRGPIPDDRYGVLMGMVRRILERHPNVTPGELRGHRLAALREGHGSTAAGLTEYLCRPVATRPGSLVAQRSGTDPYTTDVMRSELAKARGVLASRAGFVVLAGEDGRDHRVPGRPGR
jgi:hypothetical protein